MKVKDFIEFFQGCYKPDDELTFRGKDFEIDAEEKTVPYWTGDRQSGTIFYRDTKVHELYFEEKDPLDWDLLDNGDVTYKGLPKGSEQVRKSFSSLIAYRKQDKEETATYPRMDLDQLVDYAIEHKEGIWWISTWKDQMAHLRKQRAGLIDKWLPLEDPKAKVGHAGMAHGDISNYVLNNTDRATLRELFKDFYPNRPTYINMVFYTEKSPYGSRSEKILLVDKPSPGYYDEPV